MKYNEKELAALACEGGSDKEGLLYKKGGQKGQSYQPRWFRLKGNLLFYFKANEKGMMTSSEPQGALVLEGCKVERFVHPSRKHCFCVGFEDDDASRVYYLSGQNDDEVVSWMEAIRKASYEYMRSCLIELQHRIMKMTGEDPLAAIQDDFKPEFSPKIKKSVAKVNPRNNTFVASSASPTSDVPTVELSLACVSLPKTANGADPSTFIQISIRRTPTASWVMHSRTETIEDKVDPEYFASITLQTGFHISFTTKLKFTVYDVNDRDEDKPLMLGEAECEVQDLVKANSSIGPMRLELRREGSQVPGYVIIAAYENEASGRKHSALDVHGDYLMPVMDKMVYAKYRVPTRSKESLKVVEELGESLFTFQIPLALLKLFSSLEQKRTADLFDLGELNDHLENVRQDILRSHFLTLGQYQGAMSDIRQQKACFKSSTVKRDRPWEFVATNLHIQRMKVILDSGQPGLAYQCVTFGAPAAHCQGFKQGGLKRMLAELRTSPSYVAGRDSPAVQANEILVKVENIRKSINEMNKQIYTSAANYATGAISSAATQISNKVQTLMQICQTEPVKSAMLGLKSALNRGGSVSEDSPSASQQSDWIWNGADYVQISSTWCLDVTLEQLVAQLALLVQVVDEVSAQIQENVVRPSSSVWHQTSSGLPISTASPRSTRHNSYRRPVASIVSSVLQNATQVDCWTQKLIPVVRRITRTAEGLCQMVTQSLKFYLFELDAGVPGSQLQALKLRKDIVVSQALTALVTAFHSMLSSNVHNKVLYHQLAEVGFLAYFESLLNTQGDEKAMLEDMYVAIQEMCNVSFKLVLAESTDQQLKISGTRTAIVVELPLPRALFEMLPMPLQWGGLIAVVPVLLTQAVIPQQLTDLTSVGSSSLQDDINSEGLAILHQYFADYRQALGGTSAQVSLEIPALADMLGRLNASYQTQKSKNVDFLTKAEQVCRRMNGARLTSCKSAKDRTGMAVTYEMCMILGNEYDLLHGVFQQVLNAIRSRGTRLENCHKNLGVRRYKFTTLQLRCAPKQYCPPEGTYGKAKD